MEFSISSATENGLALVILTDPTSHTKVAILPAYGAMLHSFVVQTKNGLHNIIDNYASQAILEKELATSFKSSKLSPFVCRTANATYTYEGQEFEFDHKFMDGSAIHGLLYNKAFKKTDAFADEQKASVAFKYHYKEEDNGYPFSYHCEIRYTLLPQNVLQVQTTVTNLDDLPIPLADGWHPYFSLGGQVNEWQLFFDATEMLAFNDKLLPTGALLPFDAFSKPTAVGNIEMDNCFLLNGNEGYPACTLRNEKNGLQINFFPDHSYPYLQLYIPPHRQSIAIENLSSAPDSFNNKMGLLMLPPRHTHTFTVHYQVSNG